MGAFEGVALIFPLGLVHLVPPRDWVPASASAGTHIIPLGPDFKWAAFISIHTWSLLFPDIVQYMPRTVEVEPALIFYVLPQFHEMVAILNLEGILCALAICTATRGYGLPTPVSSRNVRSLVGNSIEVTPTPIFGHNVPNSMGHSGEAIPTPVSSNVPSLVGHSRWPIAIGNLFRRERHGYCDDMCARTVDMDSLSVKNDFENHCSSFLATTVGLTTAL
jgi:hypothetical protein